MVVSPPVHVGISKGLARYIGESMDGVTKGSGVPSESSLSRSRGANGIRRIVEEHGYPTDCREYDSIKYDMKSVDLHGQSTRWGLPGCP